MKLTEWNEQVYDFLLAAKAFCDETKYLVTFNQDKALQDLALLLENQDECSVFLNYQLVDEVPTIAGFAIAMIDSMFTDKPFGDVYKFYVMPEFRGSKVSRELVQECVDWFDANDAVSSYAYGDARVGEDGKFNNLFKKFGYVPATQVMVRHNPRYENSPEIVQNEEPVVKSHE
jgi:GNAT superfamily N-acetyltransferase